MALCLRKLRAKQVAAEILSLFEKGCYYGDLESLLADYDALERENEELRRKVAELERIASRCIEHLSGEEWRDIEGYEGLYQVSNLVRFKSFHRGVTVIRLPHCCGSRYADICLSKNGKSVSHLVHRVVAKAFVPNPDPLTKTEVHHVNGNKHDNRPENLMWVSPEEHIQYALQDENNPCGKPHYAQRKLSDEQVRYIRENPDGLSQIKLGKFLGVSNSTVWMIQHRKIYMDVK